MGGPEEDGVSLAGTVDGVTVGDAGNIDIMGTFEDPNFAGEAFRPHAIVAPPRSAACATNPRKAHPGQPA